MRIPLKTVLPMITVGLALAWAPISDAAPLQLIFKGKDSTGRVTTHFTGSDVDGDGWITYNNTGSLPVPAPSQEVTEFEAKGFLKDIYFDISCDATNPYDCFQPGSFGYSFDNIEIAKFAIKTDLSDILIYMADYQKIESFTLTADLATITMVTDGRYMTTTTRSLPVTMMHVVPVPASLALTLTGLAALGGLRAAAQRRNRRVAS